jgi:oxygen-independent coproporphyrinogen-3 oxidase
MHIPFCRTLCSFCYFRVLAGRGSAEMSTYTSYILREMEMYKESLQGLRCESIYIGGGTPTSLEDEHLVRIFEGVRRTFDLDHDAEITIESAPGTLAKEKVALLKELGVNRLSYGIQSLNEKLLATMNRYYTVDGAIKELEEALSQISNINIDTMYGFEEEPDDALLKTLTTFDRIGVPCVTIYSLDTQRNVRQRVWLGPPRDDLFFKKIEIYQRAQELLPTLGYQPLFQNTFAKPGLGSYRHQLRRWENVTLIGLGLGSMGYAPRKPYQNYGTLSGYSDS